MTDYLLEKI